MKKEQIEILINECRILPSTNYPEPVYRMGISDGKNIVQFGGEGDLSVVTGKAKSTKTFLMGIMAASALTHSTHAENKSNSTNKIIYFDTEQSYYNASKSLYRITAIAGKNNNDDIQYYALRGLNVSERIKFIDHVLKITPEVKAVFIDGARDLVSSINDEHQATLVIDLFAKWTRMGAFHLVTVLHENSSTEKLRGHLGTELTNKAENVFVVALERNSICTTSNVYTRYSRNGNYLEFSFFIGDDGIPKINLNSKKQLDYNEPEVISCLKEVFNDNPQMGHTQLMSKFQAILKDNGIEKGKNVLKIWLINYLDLGVLCKEGNDRSPRAYYYLKS